MDELITKANHAAGFLVSDLQAAHKKAIAIQRPEGPSRGDKALILVLGDLLKQAREIEAKIASLG